MSDVARADHDFDILIKRGQEFHQAFARELVKLAYVQNPGRPPGSIQRVVESTSLAQRERPLAQGADLRERQRRQHFVKRANLLNRPLRTRTVGGVGGDG